MSIFEIIILAGLVLVGLFLREITYWQQPYNARQRCAKRLRKQEKTANRQATKNTNTAFWGGVRLKAEKKGK